MSLKRYSEYSKSDTLWSPSVPSSWRVLPTKRGFSRRKELNVNLKCENRLSLTLNGVLPRSMDDLDGLQASEFETYQIFKEDDLVFKLIDLQNIKTSRVGIVHEEGIMSPAYIRLEPKQKLVFPRYAFWFFTDLYKREVFNKLGEGVRQTLGPEELLALPFFYPPIEEQKSIVSFLDYETTQIDALVDEQYKLISLLKEKRQVFITNAVTKGLNQTVEMKESGVEWIGLIPKHWTVRRLKYLADIRTGDKDTENSVGDGEYPFFVRSQTIERINSYTYDCEAILTAGDGAGVGKVFHYFNGPFDFHQRVYMLNNFKEVAGKYLFHFFKENFFKVALEGGAKSTVDSLRRPMLTNFFISFPDIDEQKNILSVIERKAIEFDELILEASKAIQLLQERRSALISATVTGQIDVRNYRPKEIA